MKIGTKSLLFGVHAFWLHPFVVAVAWWRLFGFPWDPRLWVAFIVHDLGYWGCPNMDGPQGSRHPELGARIMGWLFDRGEWQGEIFMLPEAIASLWSVHPVPEKEPRGRWEAFCLYHSRTYARLDGQPPSKLAAADKLAWSIEPWWLYVPRAMATGEIREYMSIAYESGFYEGESRREWYRRLQQYGRAKAEAFVAGRSMGVQVEPEIAPAPASPKKP